MASKAILQIQETMSVSDNPVVNNPPAQPERVPAANFAAVSDATPFLNGKVKKRSLPQVQGRPGPDAPVLKLLKLPQGDLAQFWDGEQSIRYMAFIELLADTVRGNHFHRRKHEFVYVIAGEVEVTVAKLDGDSREAFQAAAGDVISIEPGVAHAYRITKPGRAIEFAPTSFDPNDTFPQLLVQV